MATYNYDEFEKSARNAGLYGTFSEADLRLARKNPDAGMSLLKYKTDWQNAKTKEQKAFANTGAERIRSVYGGYTGGDDGGSFRLDDPSPADFTYSPSPTYESKYSDRINSLIGEITSRKDFSYDYKTDPLYSAYKKQYLREGERATSDALGQASAMTGGALSSYAQTAASQAGDYYASKLSDKIPELYQVAYNKYLDDFNAKLSSLSALRSAENDEYNKYLGELDRYKSDRSFDYSKFLDEMNKVDSDRKNTFSEATSAAEYGDTSRLRDLGIDTGLYDEQFKAQVAAQKAQEAKYLAQVETERAKAGKYSGSSGESASGNDDETDIERIFSKYDGKRITDENDWNTLVAAYGEDTLKEAGYSFSKKTGKETKSAASGVPSFSSTREAMNYISKNNIGTPLLESEWRRAKMRENSMDYSVILFDNYLDYLNNFIKTGGKKYV